MSIRILSIAVLGGLLSFSGVGAASAVTIVHWGGDYVSEHQVFANTEYPGAYRAQGNNSVLSGSLSTTHSPAEGYTAPAGRTSGFSMGWMAMQGTAPGIPGGGGADGYVNALHARVVYNNGVNDQIVLSMTTAVNPASIRGMVTFGKAGFLDGLSGEQIAFDSNSSFTFKGIMDGFRPVGRWVVQDGGQWYISESVLSQTAYNTVETHVLNDPGSIRWAAFNPLVTDTAGPYYFNAAPETGYETHAFNNVQSVGVFFDSYGEPRTDGGFTRFALQEFSVTATTAIPEPSTAMLVVLSLGAAAMVYRRK